MLGDGEGYCSLRYPKRTPCKARMEVEQVKSHGKRKARCNSERLHVDVKLDLIIKIIIKANIAFTEYY
jgi:hypothetical protein